MELTRNKVIIGLLETTGVKVGEKMAILDWLDQVHLNVGMILLHLKDLHVEGTDNKLNMFVILAQLYLI